jgi:hypothetical protein
MFSLFQTRPKLPASFERWNEVDGVASSEFLHEGPSVLDVRNLKQWLDPYERWNAGYIAFVKAERTILDGGGFSDDFDRRQYDYYTALFFQSGEWLAILLMLLEDVSESDRSRYLAEIDSCLSDLRRRIVLNGKL